MKVILQFLKSRLFVQLVGVLALSLLIWFAGPLVSFAGSSPLLPETNRLVAIGLLVVAWITFTLITRKRSDQKDIKLVTELSMPQLNPERAAIEAAQNEQMADLQEKFAEALQLLKKSRSTRKRDRHYLYELPWYIIIGYPAVGKTTLLYNSGLHFPLSERFGKSLRGVGGTRDCDWFFTDEAIIIDTAGRFVSQDSHQPVDKSAWSGFLELLKKYRPRRPINGVLVTMSVADALGSSEEELQEESRTLRQRIMELYEVLGNGFPLYMVFTKCDLIAGFNDFFSDLGQEERLQVWGETFPTADPKDTDDHIAVFENHFDQMLGRLNQRTIRRIQEEKDIQRRRLIMTFPQQMWLLKPTISRLLNKTFGISRFELAPMLRGVYFTSATQKGTPIDRVMSRLAATYERQTAATENLSGLGKSFFITRLLKEVILPESELAGVDSKVEQRRRWLRWGAYACLGCLTAGSLALWTLSYTRNRSAIGQVEKYYAEYAAACKQVKENDSGVRQLVVRLNALKAAQSVYSEQPSWTMRWGLYQGAKIQSALSDAYERELKDNLLPLLRGRLEWDIYNYTRKGNPSDSGALYELVKFYVMLGDPEKMDPKLAGALIENVWQRTFEREPKLQAQLSVYSRDLLRLAGEPALQDATAEELIREARRKLKAIPLPQQIYAHLKSKALPDHSHDFVLQTALPPHSDLVFDRQTMESLTIPGLFTYDGYNDYFRKQGLELVRQALEENWVLGAESYQQPDDLNRVYDDLQKLYLKEYGTKWRNLLENLKFRKVEGVQDSLQIIDRLSGPETPLRSLLEAVEKNTSLARSYASNSTPAVNEKTNGDQQPTSSGVELLQSEAVPAPVRQLQSSFSDLNKLVESSNNSQPPIDNVLLTLSQIRDALMQATSGTNTKEQVLQSLMESGIIGKAKIEFTHLPAPINDWLLSLVSFGFQSTLESARTELNALWKTDVFAPYMKGLQDRYPLFRKSPHDATIADFSQFFSPNGTIDKFFQNHLKNFIDTTGPTWRQILLGNHSIQLSNEALNQLQYAENIRKAFFAGGESIPSFQFQLKPISLNANAMAFRLNIEGQTEEYSHGPIRSSSFQWPGPHPDLGVIMTFDTFDGKMLMRMEEGPWAWLRMLDNATVRPTPLPDVFKVTFRIDNYEANYELRAGSVNNPFHLTELQKFRCPESL